MTKYEAIQKYGVARFNAAVSDFCKFYALPPFNQANNYVAYDGYFARSLSEKYPEELIEAVKRYLGK